MVLSIEEGKELTPAEAKRMLQVIPKNKWTFHHGDASTNSEPYVNITHQDMGWIADAIGIPNDGKHYAESTLKGETVHFFHGDTLKILADAGANFENSKDFRTGRNIL